MKKEVQISFVVTPETKERFERYVRQKGLKKGYVIEQALTQYLSAVDQIPQDYIVPTRIVLTRESFEKVVEAVEKPRKPTKALRELMAGSRRRKRG